MKRIKMLLNKLRRHSKNEEGAVALLVAFLMVIMLGCAAFALDYGMVYMKKAELQNAVDIAARATSKILVDGSLDGKNDNDKDAILTQKAKYYLKENGFPENKLSKCKVVANVNSGISIDADYDVKMNFARIFDVNSVKVSAATTAVTDVNVIEGKKMTADVVFILDISGSMYWWNGSNIDKSSERFIPKVKRTPAVFLLSDGEANWGSTNYCGDLGTPNVGNGSSSNAKQFAEAGYYSILTANSWKAKLKEKYSRRNGEETNPIFYTMGFRLNTDGRKLEYERAVLNPDSLPENPSYDICKQLKPMLKGWSNPYKNNYKYNDKYYEAYSSNALEVGLEEFAANVIEATKNYNTRLTK